MYWKVYANLKLKQKLTLQAVNDQLLHARDVCAQLVAAVQHAKLLALGRQPRWVALGHLPLRGQCLRLLAVFLFVRSLGL